MNMNLHRTFNEWTDFTGQRFSDRQWLLAKWEVFEGVVWPGEKIEVMLATITDRLGLSREHVLADLGCGGGWIAERLSSHVGQVVGLDFSWGMIKNARSLLPSGSLVQGAIGELPFRRYSFDRILCYFVFINVLDDRDVERFLLDMFRVLKPGGRILVGQLPDRAGSRDYDQAKASYFEYCRDHFQLGDSLRDKSRVAQKLFDLSRIQGFLQTHGIRHEVSPSFNPFYRDGEPRTVSWRFDLVLHKD